MPLIAARATVRAAAADRNPADDNILISLIVVLNRIGASQNTLTSGGDKAISRRNRSLLRDRNFDMLFEGRPFAHAVIPGLEILQWRPLDRKGMPTIYLSPQGDL